MSKKLYLFFALLLAFSMLLSACGTPAPTEAPVVEAPVTPEVVVTEAPVGETVPDVAVLFDTLVDSLPTDTGYGTVKAAPLSEEMADKMPFLLDVREAAEVEKDGYIEGAVNIPVREILNNLDKLPGLDEPIVIYCASGHRGSFAFASLKLLGYTDVRNLNGGLGAWKKAELPVVTGSMPESAAAISTPVIADEALFGMLNGFLTTLPEGFYNIKSDGLMEQLAGATPPTVIDLRTQPEREKEGYIEGALHVPVQELFSSLDKLPGKDEAIVVHCAGGQRSGIALEGLRLLGYTNVINLGGGFNAWKAAGLPVAGWVDWPVIWGEFIAAIPADQGFYTVKADVLNSLLAEEPPFIVDVREASEIADNGYITGAVNIPVRELLKNLDKLPAQDQKIVVYCASGHRAALATAALRLLGYTDVVNLAGGINGWLKAEFAVETGMPAAPVPTTAPEVDATRLAALDTYLNGLPEGFGAIKPADLNTEIASGTVPFILDLRSEEEKATDGYIEGSTLIFINDLPANLAQLPTDKAAPVVVTCKSGHRGGMVMMYLNFLGYTNVRNLGGGMNGWAAAELPVVK